MKKLFIASGLLALMAAATSCDKYDIYDDQYGDVLLIKDGGEKSLTLYSTDDYADTYISVMKSGHSPERESNATLRLMSEADFNEYKDINYGSTTDDNGNIIHFEGLKIVDPSLYDLLDSEGNVVSSISHKFSGSNDRYFGATLRVKSREFADWIRAKSADETSSANFVIPIGLYSETDSVNEYNNVLVFTPEDIDPEVVCDVADNTYNIEDLSRRQLIKDAGQGLVYKPEVYMSVPCKNPWGFKVAIANNRVSHVSTYNSDKNNTVTLTAMPQAGYALLDEEGNPTNEIVFEPGETKARIPLTIYLDNLVPDDDLDKNLVVPFQITNPRANPAISWINTPEQTIVDRLKLTPSTFFIGVRVVEEPLPLDDTCVTSNDCEPTEGSIAALFDDNLSTFFHSGWTVAFERSAPYGSYLEIALPEEVNAVYFSITARNTNQRSPKEIHLYYSNDPEDENSWVFFQKATNSKALKAGESFDIGKINKMFHTDDYKTFKYMRFCVMKNDKNEDLTTTSTSIYWNLAELKLYGKILTPEDQQ